MQFTAIEGILFSAGAVVLGLILAWGGYQTVRYRRERGLPVGARQANPQEAGFNAAVGQGREKSAGTYALRLGVPILVAFVIIALAVWTYVR